MVAPLWLLSVLVANIAFAPLASVTIVEFMMYAVLPYVVNIAAFVPRNSEFPEFVVSPVFVILELDNVNVPPFCTNTVLVSESLTL